MCTKLFLFLLALVSVFRTNKFSRMIREITTLFGILLTVLCCSVHAKTIYRYNTPLDFQRYYTTQIISELTDNYVKIIDFDSKMQLLSHKIVTGKSPEYQCTDRIVGEQAASLGHAYKYWLSNQLDYCEIDSRSFPYIYDSIVSELIVEPSIIILNIPNDIPSELELPNGTLIQHVFDLIPIADFSSLYPVISKRLTQNGTLVVKEGKYTFQLLLLSKGDMK